MTSKEAIEEELTAYIDGELSTTERQRVEERLAREPDFRKELQRLQRAWDLLDQLPRATVDENFARSTIEMVAIAAENEARTQAIATPRRRNRNFIAAGLGLAATGVAGFVIGIVALPNSNDQLLRDLPIIEDFELYRQVDSMEFLRQFEAAKLLDEEPTAALPATTASDGTIARREHVQNLSPSEQQRLMRNQERFHNLPVDMQERIGKLHDDITHAVDAEKLRATLVRYHEWLKTLSPEQRAELLQLAWPDRIDRIKSLIAKQKDEHDRRPNLAVEGPRLSPEDRRVLFHWFEEIAWQHRDKLIESIPRSERREKIEKQPESIQKQTLALRAMWQWSKGPLPITPKDLERLYERLSAAAQAELAKLNDPQAKRRLAREWLRQAAQTRMEGAAGRRGFATVSSDEMERFFLNELTDDQRQKLLNLPRDQMQERLRQLYLQHAMRPDGPPRPPFGPPGRGNNRRDWPGRNRPGGGPPDGQPSRAPRRPPSDDGGADQKARITYCTCRAPRFTLVSHLRAHRHARQPCA